MKKEGAHPYQFHIFRESLFMKYTFHVFFAVAVFLPSQAILSYLLTQMIHFYWQL